MKIRSLGILIIIIGIIMLIYSGFIYVTDQKVIDLGSVKIIRELNHSAQLTPILAVVLIIGGIVLIVTENKIHV